MPRRCALALHPDGHVYAAYFRWTSAVNAMGTTCVPGTGLGAVDVTADVVVVRDDHGGAGPCPTAT